MSGGHTDATRLSANQRLITYADVQEMLASLGDFMDTESESTSVQASTSTTADTFTTVSDHSMSERHD